MNMSSRERSTENVEEEITLVPTNVPEGMVVHTEFGVSENLFGPKLSFQLKDKKKFYAVKASEVGLEWRDGKNQKIKESEKFANESFVLVEVDDKK